VKVQVSSIESPTFVAISASRALIVPIAIHYLGLSIDTIVVTFSGMRINPQCVD
jgi:hypothetical protein